MFVPKLDGGSGCFDEDDEQLICVDEDDELSVDETIDEELEEELLSETLPAAE